MATPTAIGTNTWALRLSDVATDATDPGFWAWYFNGMVKETWDMGIIGAYNTGGDLSGVTTFGQMKLMYSITGIEVKTKANLDLIKRAFRQWNDSDTDLYFNFKVGGTDRAYWTVATTWATVTEKMRVRIAKINWKVQTTDLNVCDLILLRVTDV